MERRLELAGVLVLIGAAVLANTLFGSARSSDLLATWIAGQMFAAERFSEIYVTSEPVFTMTPPKSWTAFMQSYSGYDDAIFPYLYPPLWAWAASLFGDIPFAAIEKGATIVNAALISGCVFLGYRITRAPTNLILFSALTLPILYLTPIGAVAIFENQPQILVCFLLLLCVDQLQNGRNMVSGLLLALAAAIKIYPAIFALLFLAQRKHKAFASFVLFGGGLGVLSILLAGWPLHREFLLTVGTAAETSIVTRLSFSLDASFAQLFRQNSLIPISGMAGLPETGNNVSWLVVKKGTIWKTATTAMLVVSMAGLWCIGRRNIDTNEMSPVWPIAFFLIPLLSPLGWPYYFISGIVLLPALVRKFSIPVCAIFYLVLFGLLALPIAGLLPAPPPVPALYALTGTACMILAIALLAWPNRPKKHG